jgi:hypothetical protein
VFCGLRHVRAAMMLRHRLMAGDVLCWAVLRDRGGRGFRHEDPRAKFRTIHIGRLCAGQGWRQQHEGRSGEQCETFHDDPAFLNECFTSIVRTHDVSRQQGSHAEDERRCRSSDRGAAMERERMRRSKQRQCTRPGRVKWRHGVENGSRVLANERVVSDKGSTFGPYGYYGRRPVPHRFVMTGASCCLVFSAPRVTYGRKHR